MLKCFYLIALLTHKSILPLLVSIHIQFCFSLSKERNVLFEYIQVSFVVFGEMAVADCLCIFHFSLIMIRLLCPCVLDKVII